MPDWVSGTCAHDRAERRSAAGTPARAQPQAEHAPGAVRGRQPRAGQPLGAGHPGLGERADADPVPGVRCGAIRSSSGCSAGSALMSTFQRASGNSSSSSSKSGTGSVPATRAVPHLAPRAGRAIRPAAVGHPVQRRVVEGDELAVRGGVHIGLDVAVAELDRAPERGRGVLQAVRRPAPVGEGERAGMVEVGVAYARGHRRSIAPLAVCPAATTVLPSDAGGDGEHAQEELGQRADGQRVQRPCRRRPSRRGRSRSPRTATSIAVRTSRIERPVRRCRPVIRPSRGPGPKRAAM